MEIDLKRMMAEGWASRPEGIALFLRLLSMAAESDTEVDGIKVGRGQLLTCQRDLERLTGVSRQTIRTLLPKLVESGWVTQALTHREERGLTHRYTLVTICNYDSYNGKKNGLTQGKNDRLTQGLTHREEEKSPIPPKEEEIKEEENIIINNNLREEEPDPFGKAMKVWLEYKKAKKQTYKTEQSLSLCRKKLIQMAGGSPEVAMLIVEQSIANNWAGLFRLKDERRYGNNDREASQARRDADFQSHILAKLSGKPVG